MLLRLHLVALSLLLLPLRASAQDLTMVGGTMTLGGVHHYDTVSLTNGATITVPPFDGTDRINTGNLVIHANSITIDATSRILAKGAGYQGQLCVPGPGPAAFPLSGGRGGCQVSDSGGGGAHFGGGGRGTIDNPPSFPSGYEEACSGNPNAGLSACENTVSCRDGDALPTVAGLPYFHSIWANEFGAAGGDKGCADADGFAAESYGPKFLTAGSGGGRIVLAAVNPNGLGTLNLAGLVRADGNRGCGHGNDSAGGGAGGSVLIVGDNVTIAASAVVSAKGGRGGDEAPKCFSCTSAAQCESGQSCIAGRCSPCNCTPCSNDGQCNAALGQTCKDLGGALGSVCADASNLCTPYDVTDNEDECVGNQNNGGIGVCDDCGGGGGGGIINVMSRNRTISVGATFNVAGAIGGICPVCAGEAGGGAGEILIDGAYVGEICDGYDNDFDIAGVVDNGFVDASCGQGSCAVAISTCSAGAPPICDPGTSNASCQGTRGSSRPRIALLLDTSASMLQNLAGTVTFGDGSLEHPGIDTNNDGSANDSKLFLAKDSVSQLIAAYPEIDFALSRYHQDSGVDRSCQTAKWLECQGSCCTYDNPANQVLTSREICSLVLPRQGGGTIPLTIHEDSPAASRCINYAGTCGAPRRGADILVGFEADVRQYMSWIDGGESGFDAGSTAGNFCNGLVGDCELRGSGPTPIAESLRAIYDYVTPIKKIDPAASCRDYSVIFVSDGGEECGGDPTVAAAELLAKGVKTYVIGVSVNAVQATTLNAIALAGGTTAFIPVTNSSQLLPALVSIVSASIRTELCNGVDDNCNGVTDEGYNIGAACDNGQRGICRGTGVFECNTADASRTTTVCNITTSGLPPTAELCNGLDDNCNGFTDEGNPQGGGPCGATGGTCIAGHLECQGGTLVCVGATGGRPETCNGDDDDCNGTVDDCGGVVNGCDGGPCGSSIGECLPGTWKCNGAAGYVCDGGSLGGPETCNGKDDDCNGAIDDNVPGTGVPCDTLPGGAPLCKPGVVRCLGGQIVCQGGVAFHPPVCACPADECGEPTDGGAQTDGCPEGSACIGCSCRTPCAAGEFPCSSSTVCRDGFCVPPDCGGKLCAAFEDCINDQCVDRCNSITCGDGLACKEGECVEDNCYGLGCPTGQICLLSTCVPDPCAAVTCPAGQFCREGACVESCHTVYCPLGEICQDGACVGDGCAMLCAVGQVCSAGVCVFDPCTGVSCGQGRACVDGSCVDDPCAHIRCPGDPSQVVCKEGQCVSVQPLPAPADREQIVGAGGGGFTCAVAGVGDHGGAAPAPLLGLFGLLLLGGLTRRRRSAPAGRGR